MFNKHPLFQFHIECFFIVHFLGNSTIFKIIFTDYILITSPSLNIFNKGYIQWLAYIIIVVLLAGNSCT